MNVSSTHKNEGGGGTGLYFFQEVCQHCPYSNCDDAISNGIHLYVLGVS